MGSWFPRINQTVLTVFLLISLPVLAVGVLLVLLLGANRVRDFYGDHLSHVAQGTAAVVDGHVYRMIVGVSLLARTPEVRGAAAAGSAQAYDPERTRTLDQQWQRADQVPIPLSGLLESPASRYLADVLANDPLYRELLLTDRHGRLIAASNRTTDYDQADEDWWKATFDDGVTGRASVTDVRWDESSRTRALEIAVPVAGPDGRFAGVLKGILDARELLAAVAGMQPGTTGQSTLLRENGTIVLSRTTTDPNARFFATQELTGALQRSKGAEGQGIDRVHFRATGPDRSGHVVGVAPSQLSRSYPNIAWVVAVSQADADFLGPMRSVGWYLVLLCAITAIIVLTLALWFSMRLAATRPGISMDLVEHAPEAGKTEGGEDVAPGERKSA